MNFYGEDLLKKTGIEFMEQTKYENISESDQRKGVEQPPLELSYDKSKPIIDLPAPKETSIPDINLRKAIDQRKSLRDYNPTKRLSLDELSWVLWSTQGVKEVIRDGYASIRTVPSAGARHAFETFLYINQVEGLEPGLYRYLAFDNKLLQISTEKDLIDKVVEGCYGQKFVAKCAVVFLWVAVPYRMAWRYSERSYRYLHLDAGHVCQNLYLTAEAIDAGVCAIAAFYDDKINKVLGLDGENHFVIYVATLGKKL